MGQMRVTLNGTDENPFHKMGLTGNPFPQIANRHIQGRVMRVQELGADPIPDVNHIQSHLEGWVTQEFIDICKRQFRKGEMVRFTMTWPD